MSKCFLHGVTPCGGKLTGEHYISRTVLEAIDQSGKSKIGGLPWQPQQTLQLIGNGALVSNMLCETHNTGLSPLDSVAGAFIRAIDAADKRPATLPAHTSVDGLLIERWFLKVVCGLAVGAGFNNRSLPDLWKQVLLGAPWPEQWGLYVPSPPGSQVLATEFYVETLTHSETKEVKGARFRVAGVHFSLLLGRPDNPQAWGTYRPRGLIFRGSDGEKVLELVWPLKTEEAVIYSKVGATSGPTPQWEGWKE